MLDSVDRYRERRYNRLLRRVFEHFERDDDRKYGLPYVIAKLIGYHYPEGILPSELMEELNELGIDLEQFYSINNVNGIKEVKNPVLKLKNGKIIEKKHKPWEYGNIRCGTGKNCERVLNGFLDNSRKIDHEERHAKEFGISVPEYRKKMPMFLSKPLTKTMEEIDIEDLDGNVKIFRFDYDSEEFGVIGSGLQTSTYYPMKISDWEDIVKRNGKKRESN